MNIFTGNPMEMIAGIAFIFGGCALLYHTLHRDSHCTMETEAQVVDYEISTHTEDGIPQDSYYPVFRYQADGFCREGTGAVGHPDQPYELGDIVKIRYNPENPDEIDVPGENKTTLFFGGVAIVLGIVFFVMGWLRH